MISQQPKKEYYCGPHRAPRILTRFLSKHFNPACRLHDINYNEKLLTQKESDKVFLKSMLELSKNNYQKVLAYSMYAAVRSFGFFFY
jgi:uncharacterized protein VirK/YbjX